MLPDSVALALVLASAFVAAVLLRWLERRLPPWLARRESGRTPPPPAAVEHWRGPVGGALLVAKLALWIATLVLVSDLLPGLMQARDDLAELVSGSFMAPLVQAGMRSWSALELIELPLMLGALWIGVGLVARVVRSQLVRAGGKDWSGVDTFTSISRYALLAAGALVILKARGIDLGSLVIFGGVLGVGIGLGVQNIARNFVSGLLLAMERPIKPGDYVSLGGFSGTVRRIGARATEVLTADHVSVLVPNARFLEEEVVNWSHGNPLCKLHVPVGVAYGSDVARVRAALLEAAQGNPKLLPDPRPTVDLDGFGDSALLFDLEVWTRDPQEQSELKSWLYYRIEANLRRHGIEVPYPQRDLHLRFPELAHALESWRRREFPESAPLGAPAAAGCEAPMPEAAAEIDPSPLSWPESQIAALAARMREPGGVAIADRRHLFRVHRQCCIGSEIVGWLVTGEKLTRDEAVAVGRRMMEQGLLRHVLDEHGFEDSYLFYRFRDDASRSDAMQ
jgi:small-conductance mechanosensitive channel